jgi:hypothetical protein
MSCSIKNVVSPALAGYMLIVYFSRLFQLKTHSIYGSCDAQNITLSDVYHDTKLYHPNHH